MTRTQKAFSAALFAMAALRGCDVRPVDVVARVRTPMVVRVDPGPWKVTAARPAYYFMGEWRLKMFVDPTENADNWYGRINCRVVDGKDVVGTGWTNWSVAPAIIDLRITTARRGDHIECEAGQ